MTDLATPKPSTRNLSTVVMGVVAALALIAAGFLLLRVAGGDEPRPSTGRAASTR